MMQLWLDGRRIDSVPQLREAFAACGADGRCALFRQLLRKHSDGLFLPWLARCPEARVRQGSLERGADAVAGALNLESARLRLEKAVKDTTEEEISAALAEICGVNAAAVSAGDSMPQSKSSKAANAIAGLSALLKSQKWYRDNATLQHDIGNLNPDRIVIDSDSLKRTLSRVAKSNDRKVTDIYLLAIEGKTICLRNIGKLRNVRLVGIGNPCLHFDAIEAGKTLDMEASNVKFDGLRINTHGVGITCHSGRCVSVECDALSAISRSEKT